MDFVEATTRATETCITLADIAEAVGVADNSIRRARMEPTAEGYRRPPEGWAPALAGLARRRAEELLALAEELDGR